MAVNLQAVSRALADQIRTYLVANGRDTNVNAFPVGILAPPSITIYPPTDPIVYHQSLGPDSDMVTLRLRLEVDAIEGESMLIKIYDYLGVGTATTSSIHDAVAANPTLDGVVVNAAVTEAQVGDPDTDPGVAWLDVDLILKVT